MCDIMDGGGVDIDIAGMGFSTDITNVTITPVSTESETMPEITVTANALPPLTLPEQAMTNNIIAQGAEAGAALAVAFDEGAVLGMWAGPFGAVIGGLVGVGIAYYVINHN